MRNVIKSKLKLPFVNIADDLFKISLDIGKIHYKYIYCKDIKLINENYKKILSRSVVNKRHKQIKK